MMLFFRFGISPNAAKLYHYVRKGSMAVPSEAVNNFWLELRERSRVRFTDLDLPEDIKQSTGEMVSTIWHQAHEAAAKNFEAQSREANEKVAHAEAAVLQLQEQSIVTRNELTQVQEKLEKALLAILESEKKHEADTHTLASTEKLVRELQKERDDLQKSLETVRSDFIGYLDSLKANLTKAEDRYLALERRALHEVERERQLNIKAEKEMKIARKEESVSRHKLNQEITRHQTTIAQLKQVTGELKGQLSMSLLQQKKLEKKISTFTNSTKS